MSQQPERYRKKPVEVEAMQWHSDRGAYAALGPVQWVESQGGEHRIDSADGALYIVTLEGEMRVQDGDWIIRGVQGEFYPCKPDVFEQSYEPATPMVDATTYTARSVINKPVTAGEPPAPSPAELAALRLAVAERERERERVRTVRKRRRLSKGARITSHISDETAAQLAKLAHPDVDERRPR